MTALIVAAVVAVIVLGAWCLVHFALAAIDAMTGEGWH